MYCGIQAAGIGKGWWAKESEYFRRLMMGFEQNDGLIASSTEPLIDARGDSFHGVVEFPVSCDLGPARRGKLCEGKAVAEFRVAFQQEFHRQQSLFHALRVIQTVHSNSQ